MRTSVLLSLQPAERRAIHPDEVLFVGVHQVHELLLMLASRELVSAASEVCVGDLVDARLPVTRATRMARLLVGALEVLEDMPLAAFTAIRPNLGAGSGAQSPGWRSLRRAARTCDRVLTTASSHRPADRLRDIATALRALDEHVAAWRRLHCAVAARLVGVDGVGTAGVPVRVLAHAVEQRLFPRLWQQSPAGSAGGAR